MILTASRDKTLIMWSLTRDEVRSSIPPSHPPQSLLPLGVAAEEMRMGGEVAREGRGTTSRCTRSQRGRAGRAWRIAGDELGWSGVAGDVAPMTGPPRQQRRTNGFPRRRDPS